MGGGGNIKLREVIIYKNIEIKVDGNIKRREVIIYFKQFSVKNI